MARNRSKARRHLRAALLALFLPVAAAVPAAAEDPPAPAPPVAAPFDADLWRDLPGSRRPWTLFETVDATAILDRIDNGGLYTGEAARLGIHGSSWTQASYRLDGLDITDPGSGGLPLLLPDPSAFASVEESSGTLPVAIGGPGPVVRFALRRPGDAWHGTGSAHTLPGGLQSDAPTDPPPIARYDGLAGGRFRVDGPLAKDGLGLLVAGSAARVRRFEGSAPARLEGDEVGLLTQLSWAVREDTEMRVVGGVQGTRQPHPGRARFAAPDAAERDRFLHLQATWERRGPAPWQITAGYVRGSFEPDPDESSPATVERLTAGPIPLLFPGRSTRQRWALGATLEPLRDALGGAEHALQVGVSAAWGRAAAQPPGPRALVAETVDGLPARVWDYGWGGAESQRQNLELAAFADERVRFGRLSLDAGVRFERTRGSASGAATAITWTGLSPRVATVLDLIPGGALALRGSYALYRNRLPLDLLAFGDPAGLQGRVERWSDSNANGRFDPGEAGPVLATLGPGGATGSIDPSLGAPTTTEFVAGLEARFAHGWTASALGVHRRTRNLVAATNVGAPADSAYKVFFVPDPGGDLAHPEDDQLLPVYDRLPSSFGQDRERLVNTGEDVRHAGVEIVLRGAIRDRFRVLVGGTASLSEGPAGNRGFGVLENDPGVLGERLLTPNAATNSRGRLFSDRAYTLKLGATWRAPGDLRLGAIARYQDGQPFARFVVPTDLAQGPEPIRAIPNGRSRFSYTLTVDARLEKGVRIGSARWAAALEVYNLFDMAHSVEEYVVWGPGFRRSTASQPPRAVLLELRAEF